MQQKHPILAFLRIMPDLLVDGHIYYAGSSHYLGSVIVTTFSRGHITYLGGTSDHVLDEVTMPWGINDSDVVLDRLKFPQSNVNGDTTLTLSFQFVQNPGILE